MTGNSSQDFLNINKASEAIAGALLQKPEFRDANPDDLQKCAYDMLRIVRSNLSSKLHAGMDDKDIREAAEIICSSPVRTRPDKHNTLGVTMCIPPQAIRVIPTEAGLPESFHYEFNPGLIVPNVACIDATQPKKMPTGDSVKAAVADGTLPQLVGETGFNFVLGAMRHMLVAIAKKRTMTGDDRAEISGMLDALVKVCKEDTAYSAPVREQHLRRIDAVRSMMSGQKR